MRKFSVVFLILSLILLTAIIKNSTKRIDDEIFATKENIRSLVNELESVKLEHNYLSSAEKLNELQDLYFEEKFIKKNIQEIKIINLSQKGFKIEKLELK